MASNSKNLAELLNGDLTVNATDIADGSVTEAKIADDAVTTNKITDGNVTGAKIGDGEVSEGKIASGAVTGAKLASTAVTADKLDVGQIGGRRNLIINGAMQVAQRGTSFSVSSDTYTLDRIYGWHDGSFTNTIEQSTDAPDDFQYSVKKTITSASSGGSSTNQGGLMIKLEGNNVSHLNWGASSAKDVTLSFWVKSSITGTYYVNFRTVSGATYSYAAEYTVNAANTWEKKTIQISGATAGTFPKDTNASFWMLFLTSIGSSFYAPSTDQWVSGNYRGTASQVQLDQTSGATFQITGVQLEVGSVATPFEHRSFGEELAACERYFEIGGGNTYFYSTRNDGISRFGLSWRTTKRASPTITIRPDSVPAGWSLAGYLGGNEYAGDFGTGSNNSAIQRYTADAEL